MSAKVLCRTVSVLVVVAGFLSSVPAAAEAAGTCSNEEFRIGPSARLAECRAFELVNQEPGPRLYRSLIGTQGSQNAVDTWLASPDGESVVFSANGSLRGEDANGYTDQYESRRTESGWTTRIQGPSGAEDGGNSVVGGSSPDHQFTFWSEQPVAFPGTNQPGTYLREKDGGPSLLGVGPAGVDPFAQGVWLTAGGTHVIFTHDHIATEAGHQPVPLTVDAPPAPTLAIYDRPDGGATRLLSLLPGEITPQADSRYLGASTDGAGVVFENNGEMYVRRNDSTTSIVATPVVGTVLSCGSSTPSKGALIYQWVRNGVAIAGASESLYEVQAVDIDASLQCEISGAGSSGASASLPPTVAGSSGASPSPPQPTEVLSAPTPGSPVAGTLEHCPPGNWTESPMLSYQWYASGTPIPGATSSTYALTPADVPSTIQCAVTAANAAGAVVDFSKGTPTEPPSSGATSILGADISGTRLTKQGGVPSIASFAGASPGGQRVFYARGGTGPYNTFEVYDSQSGATTVIANEGQIFPVNVSEDGSHAFFISTAVLALNQNSADGSAEAGGFNIYYWTESGVRYVATLEELNELAPPPDSGEYGLGLWTTGLNPIDGRGPAIDPSRTTPDGSVFVFQTRTDLLPGYSGQGNSEIYRFDAASESLECVSCNPAGTPATTSAELETLSSAVSEQRPASEQTHISNVTPDGEVIVFQTKEALTTEDTDGVMDVYVWRNGNLHLVSSGQNLSGKASAPNFLYGMSSDARDIFFVSNDTLTQQDLDGHNRSIYDARIDGGFAAPPPPSSCDSNLEVSGCQGGVVPAPILLGAVTSVLPSQGNVIPTRVKKKKRGHGRGNGGKRQKAKHRLASRGGR